MNKSIQITRLTKDPESSFTTTGTQVAKFSGAINDKYGDTEKVYFFNYVAFGKTAEIICQYVKKGQRLAVECKPVQNRWQDSEGRNHSTVEFVVNNFTFIEKAGGAQTADPNESLLYESANTSFEDLPETNPFSDDDIPF